MGLPPWYAPLVGHLAADHDGGPTLAQLLPLLDVPSGDGVDEPALILACAPGDEQWVETDVVGQVRAARAQIGAAHRAIRVQAVEIMPAGQVVMLDPTRLTD